MFNLFKKRKYYYVQRCPECQSRVTGRYIKRPRYDTDALYIERNSLAHGELIRFADHDIVKNCYCEDCGFEWRYEVVGRLISPERYAEEGEVRHTRERLALFNEEHPQKKSVLKAAFGILPRY